MTASLDDLAIAELHGYIESVVIDDGLASCQYALAVDGAIVASATIGDAPRDARYLLFSATKVIPAAAVWRLLDDGSLELGRPVSSWWPGFATNDKGSITLEHVLTHACGLPSADVSPAAISDRDRRVTEMERWRLEWEPGSRSSYHAFSAHWILAELIARATGADHRAAIRNLVLDPLRLDSLELGTRPDRQGSIQPLVETGEPPTRAELADHLGASIADQLAPSLADGLRIDDTVALLASPPGYAAGIPGAGAVSDAASLALLYQALLTNDCGLWSHQTLAEAIGTVRWKDPGTVGNAAWRGLGVDIAGDGPQGERRYRLGSGFTSPAAFGHSGAGGQIGWVDPASGLSFAFVTNGWDRNPVRCARRDRTLNRLATACVH